MFSLLLAKLGVGALPEPLKKLIVYAVLVALTFWAFKVFWLNPHDAAVAAATATKVTDQVKKEEEARWKPIQEALLKQNAELQKQLVSIKAEIAELQASRVRLEKGLQADLAKVKQQEAVNRSRIDLIPVEKLQETVNALSAQLAGTGQAPTADPRLVLNQLEELQSLRTQVAKLEDYIKAEKATYDLEKVQWNLLLEGERKSTDLVKQGLELEKQKSALYDSLYKAVKKKGCGVGGILKRIFTLGLARCG